MFRILFRLIKRLMVIVPLMMFTGISVVFAYFVWLLLGEGAGIFSMPFEAWGEKLMEWAER